MAVRKTVTLYTVQSLCWMYNDEWHDPPPEGIRFDDDHSDAFDDEYTPPRPMRTFLTREAAEEHQQRLERIERRNLNPMHYGEGGDLSDFSTRSPAELVQMLQQAGLDPPALHQGQLPRNFWEWLYQGLETWGEEERETVWEACDKIRFFSVVTVKVVLSTDGREREVL